MSARAISFYFDGVYVARDIAYCVTRSYFASRCCPSRNEFILHVCKVRYTSRLDYTEDLQDLVLYVM